MPGIYKNGMKLIPGGYIDKPINGIRSYPDQFGRLINTSNDEGVITPNPLISYEFLTDATNTGTGGVLYDGVTTGNVTYDGKANFTGSSDRITIPNVNFDEFTLEFDVNTEDTGTYIPVWSFEDVNTLSKNTLFHKYESDFYSILFKDTTIVWDLYNNDNNINFFETEINIKMRYKSYNPGYGILEIIINNKRNWMGLVEGYIDLDNINDFVIGADIRFNQPFSGYLKNWKLWDVMLSDEQIGLDNPRLNITDANDLIILLATGQSNTKGYEDPNLDSGYSSNIMNLRYRYDNERNLLEYMETYPNTNFCFYASSNIQKAFPTKKVIIINVAEGGQEIARWDKGADESLYDKSVLLTNVILDHFGRSAIDGVIWHQGEADQQFGNTQVYYEGKLNTVKDNYRADIGTPTTPFIVGDHMNFINENDPLDPITLALRTLNTDGDDNTSCIQLRDIPKRDVTHASNEGYLIGGGRYATTFINMKNN